MKRRKFLLFSSLICTCRTLVPESISGSYSIDHVNALEGRLLQMFGFSRVPSSLKEAHSSIPKVLKEMYHYQNGDTVEDHYEVHTEASDVANTIRHHREKSSTQLAPNEHLLTFDFLLPEQEELHHSELILHTHQMSNNTRLNIYSVSQANEKILIATKIMSGAVTERFDLTQATQEWLRDGNNYRIMLQFEDGDSSHVRLRRSTDSNFDDAPVLLSYTNDGSSSPTLRRSRRRAGRKKTHLTKNRRPPCKRHSLKVDFEELDWHRWIVAPAGYESYYCAGKCEFPMDAHLNATNHGTFNSFLNSLDPTVTDGACCIPTELKPLHLLYLDDDERAVLRAYEDMVVEACGCR
jgi:hypothetical protein